MFTVTRQLQWPDGTPIVELSQGGMDYTNPDALSPKYDGEMAEYESPVEACEAAIAICKEWRQDGEQDAAVAYGGTGGMTMPFEACEFDNITAWAKQAEAELEKCAACGEIMADRTEWYLAGQYTDNDFYPYDDGEKYCSESCAEKNSEFQE